MIFRHPDAPVSALPLIYTGASLDWRVGRGPICNNYINKYFIFGRVAKGLMLVMCEKWVGDGERLPHIDPKFLWPWQFFFILLGCSTVGPEGPSPLSGAGSHSGTLSPTGTATRTSTLSNSQTASNWLTQAVFGTWLYNCLTYTSFLWTYASAPNSTMSTGQGDIPTSSTGCTCFCLPLIYTGASLDWRVGRGPICNNYINKLFTRLLTGKWLQVLYRTLVILFDFIYSFAHR